MSCTGWGEDGALGGVCGAKLSGRCKEPAPPPPPHHGYLWLSRVPQQGAKEGSPDAHFAVHDGRVLEARQQVLHLDVELPIMLYHPIICWDIGLQCIASQAFQALLLIGAMSLQDMAQIPGLEVS